MGKNTKAPATFVVCKGVSVQTNTKRHVPEGDTITADELSPFMLKDLLNNKFIEPLGVAAGSAGASKNGSDEPSKPDPQDAPGGGAEDGVVPQIGRWDFDPAVLADKSLTTLNAIVLERDPDVSPFDTPEEARAFLSQHFQG